MNARLVFSIFLFISASAANAQSDKKSFSESFMQDSCTFSSTGRNAFFVLQPGYQLILEGRKGSENGRPVITVLNETQLIDGIETRVVEENEAVNGKTVEISRNFFAICKQTNTVFYFGEEVDMYKGEKITGHEGSWRAGGKNRTGVVMTAFPLLGARYYQEIAPGMAMDRAEVVSTSEIKKTPAGIFSNCLKTEETTPLEPGDREYKYYAPGIGLVQEQHLLLVHYGFK